MHLLYNNYTYPESGNLTFMHSCIKRDHSHGIYPSIAQVSTDTIISPFF